ncbi:MAG: energy-converting hydrogenase B subunit P [Euryarchaeota archaeon]|nr:energy-converting hydrogenase B subunit P [Euryarchaeota archaeon]MBU4608404.1 energy-converting hydrogenase B subunit P [Euryarchaeota archaeon]MBV1728807.1 energy-converting hydrogenase B subunit P [Methanobacterium sp.]MBV1755468.1 energy-converting hydrogenase B subunit P [Methanobacterium sp.]MBV1766793.1 energy-converting hydrogenase B subunit P [Methanobacterium sp.]
MKFIVRAHHILSLGGYIVELEFPYRNIIVVNPTPEPIKIEIPVFDEEWIEEHRNLGLQIIPVKEEDNYLAMWRKEKAKLEKIKAESA